MLGGLCHHAPWFSTIPSTCPRSVGTEFATQLVESQGAWMDHGDDGLGYTRRCSPVFFCKKGGGSVCKDVFSPILIYIYYICLKKDLFFVHSISLGQEIELFKLMIITSCKAFFQLSSDQTKTLVGCFLQRIALPSCEQGPCLNQLGFHEMSLPVCCHWSAIQEQSVRTVQGPIWSETP